MNIQILAIGVVLSLKTVSCSSVHRYPGHHQYNQEDLKYNGPTAIPNVLHDGHIADTHEVAAAKAEHFAAIAKAQAHSGHGKEYGHGSKNEHSQDKYGHLRYHGPTAIPHVLHDGHIADTHEVAAAKAEHFNAVAKAMTHYSYGHGNRYARHAVPYHGPLAKPIVLHNGYLADTYEVAAAKSAHLSTLAHLSHGYSHGHANSHDNHGHQWYQGPTSIPLVLHDGHIADTQEVAAAKAEHFNAVAKAMTLYSYGHGNIYARHAVPYHGPLAKPVVLHNGYLADTHEVAAAKSAHLSTLAHQSHGYSHGHANSHDNHEHQRYQGPTAIPHVLHDGHIADTQEVAAAKAEHFAAIAKAHTHGGYRHDSYSHGYAHNTASDGQISYGHAHSYDGPLAKPVVLHNGYLADTNEVAAAKKVHLQALHSSHSTYHH